MLKRIILILLISLFVSSNLFAQDFKPKVPTPAEKIKKAPLPKLPDLIVKEIKCGPGNKVLFVVANIGTASLPPGWKAIAKVSYHYAIPINYDLGHPTSGDITPPGGTASYLVDLHIIPGRHSVTVFVDATNSITELNETNNTITSTLEPCQPDLSVFDWLYEGKEARYLAAESARQGETKTISMSVSNYGAPVTGDFTVGIYLSSVPISPPSSPPTSCAPASIRLWQTTVTGGLRDAETKYLSATITIPTTLPPGDYWIFYMADDTNRISEANEINNCSNSFKLTVTAP
jgi:hypothetical protein